MSKCPSSIRRRDSNPRPFKHELSPITTRPGLPPLLCFKCITLSLIGKRIGRGNIFLTFVIRLRDDNSVLDSTTSKNQHRPECKFDVSNWVWLFLINPSGLVWPRSTNLWTLSFSLTLFSTFALNGIFDDFFLSSFNEINFQKVCYRQMFFCAFVFALSLVSDSLFVH